MAWGDDEEHTPGGEAAGEAVADMVDGANERAAAAEDAAQAITDAAVQTEVVRTVETRLGEFETWQGETDRRLTDLQSNQERLLGLMTAQNESLAAILSQPQPQPAPPPEPSPEPQPQTEPSTPPPQPSNPADAADAAPAPAARPPEPAAKKRPKRRFW